MVVLNLCKKIDTICISKKLGLYISNLKDCPYGNWEEYVAKEYKNALEISKITSRGSNIDLSIRAYEHCQKHFPDLAKSHSGMNDALIEQVVSNLICVYLDYDYEDMPLGGWDENPFDGRFCENDYAELIVNFIHFLSNGEGSVSWIYSSNYDETTPFYKFMWITSECAEKIANLEQWGEKFDTFLSSKNDYLKLDYLIRNIFDKSDNDAYQVSKLYSICQLFLENKKESELDNKLPMFMDQRYSEIERNEMALLLRQMRNKVAHGDFVAFENKAEEYAQKFMDGHYWFDYSEYSRKNWVLLNVCCLLSDIVKAMINKMFENKEYMDSLKKSS